MHASTCKYKWCSVIFTCTMYMHLKYEIHLQTKTFFFSEITSEVPLQNFESEFEDQQESNIYSNNREQQESPNEQAHNSRDHRYSCSDIQLHNCPQEQSQTNL